MANCEDQLLEVTFFILDHLLGMSPLIVAVLVMHLLICLIALLDPMVLALMEDVIGLAVLYQTFS